MWVSVRLDSQAHPARREQTVTRARMVSQGRVESQEPTQCRIMERWSLARPVHQHQQVHQERLDRKDHLEAAVSLVSQVVWDRVAIADLRDHLALQEGTGSRVLLDSQVRQGR